MNDRIVARYWLETPDDPERAAQVIAGEQSSGTFVKLANETDELLHRAGARIEALQMLDSVSTPSLPGRYGNATRFTRAQLTLSWPLNNLGASLPNLMATVAGNLFELQCVSGLRLQSLTLPDAFVRAQPGTAFGAAGTRARCGVAQGPLIGTIIKPSVGLTAAQTAEEVRKLVDGGIDFIKDDELQADGPLCPFEARVDAVMRVVNEAAQRDGRKVMIAFNVTGDVDEMRQRVDFLQARGGTCAMVSAHSVGLAGLLALRKHSPVPLHVHRNGWGYLSRHPALGWDYAPWQMLLRLAGADHLHVNGLDNKFSESNESVLASARAVLSPISANFAHACMPVFSSGQTGLQAAPTFHALNTTDLIFAAGGGIFGHPSGVRAGVMAMRQAWDAAMRGVDVRAAAQEHPELAQALPIWR